MKFSTGDLTSATGGKLCGSPAMVDGVSIDSRTAANDALFVPIVAERDGHDFIPQALEAGAAAYLTSQEPGEGTSIAVADTAQALSDLGVAVRRRISGEVIGVTGSVGKTSTKDLLAAALASSVVTYASEKSHNNELGVPLTLCNAPDDVAALVVEMGARGIGHVRQLCDIAAPTIGIVTTVTAAHTELFGSVEAVAEGKGELIESLPATGTAVLNSDVDLVAAMAERTEARVLTFGAAGDVRAESVSLDDNLRPSFTVASPWGSHQVALQVAGLHQVDNALAAFAAACAAGIEPDAAACGLGTAALSPWRMDLRRTAGGVVVINDAYNANPASTTAALRALGALEARRKVAVLGVMAELGDQAESGHREVSDLAAELGIEVIAVNAPLFAGTHVDGLDAAQVSLGELNDGDAVLLKGSRVAGLERLAAKLLA